MASPGNRSAFALRELALGAPYPYSDGMGGVLGVYSSSPPETNLHLPSDLPTVPGGAEEVVVGNMGMEDQEIKGNSGPAAEGTGHSCGVGGCDFSARSGHGLARHIKDRHGYGGLGRRIGK